MQKLIDIDFDYRKDSRCGDPDKDSTLLYEVLKEVFSKPLANGEKLELKVGKVGSQLVLSHGLGDNLSCDRMCPHFGNDKTLKDLISPAEKDVLAYKVRTLGGHIVFPAHRKNGMTINQSRGFKSSISDRFDLTLECIKRFYDNSTSPLFETLKRYEDFFALFVDFKGYIDFFLLEDFVNDNYEVVFSLPFDDFKGNAIPNNIEAYKHYYNTIIALMDKRTKRMINALGI